MNINSTASLRLTAFALQILALLLMASAVVPAARGQLKPEVQQFLDRVYNQGEFDPKGFGPARWLENGDAYTTVEDSATLKDARKIVRYATATGERSVLVSAAQLTPAGAKAPLAIMGYAWSSDMSKALIYTNAKRVWRAPTRGDYWVLDRKSGALKKLGGDAAESTLMFAKFSPDGSKVGYVRERNVYVEDLGSGTITALTHDTAANIINGTSDWVYEEELFLRDGFRWSPDGKSIAYWQFDTSGVGIFPLIYNLGAPKQIVTGFPYPGLAPYPSRLDIPYPIPGTQNSAVRVGVVGAGGGETRWLKVPGDPRDNYIARIEWCPKTNQLLIEHLNRAQNTNDILLADATTGDVKPLFQDKDEAWVDAIYEFKWLNDGKEFLFPSERSGWRHYYRVSRETGAVKAITHGDFDVIDLAGMNEKDGWLYFDASPQNATQRYLYRTKLDGSGTAERVSPADTAGTHDYDVSPDGRWAFHTFDTFDSPPTIDLVKLPAHGSVRSLLSNDELRAKVAPFIAATPKEFFKVDLGEGVSLDGFMIRPKNFDATKKYPVFVYIYGEPAGQTVLDTWSEHTFGFLRTAASEGYIVVSFDNRGTPAPKGRAWRKQVHGAIHPVIVKDQTAALKKLMRERPYMDASRVGVNGWSGGGSSTLSLMFRSPDVYKVGMAGAPVPELRLYDTIYQERYMGLPLENVEGYKASSAINYADGLKGRLLIVHGSGDDNVHYAGTELLMNRLIELGRPFDFMEYPNRTHCACEGKGVSYHLNSLFLRYLEQNLPAGPVGQ